MAVNDGAKMFYQLHGFVTEQEESSNQAHYRYPHDAVLVLNLHYMFCKYQDTAV